MTIYTVWLYIWRKLSLSIVIFNSWTLPYKFNSVSVTVSAIPVTLYSSVLSSPPYLYFILCRDICLLMLLYRMRWNKYIHSLVSVLRWLVWFWITLRWLMMNKTIGLQSLQLIPLCCCILLPRLRRNPRPQNNMRYCHNTPGNCTCRHVMTDILTTCTTV